jgi:nucleoside phosphorylase
MAMLDERHNSLSNHARDSNIYVLGRIGKHNVANACLPETGAIKVAEVPTMMLISFPSIQFGLMVGIGGAIPSEAADIRLGDIVVSRPEGTDPGVIQYDIGKIVQGRTFQRKRTLTKPPPLLLSAAIDLATEYGLEKQLVKDLNASFIEWFPDWAAERSYPGADSDRLFLAEYNHVGGSTCDTCDENEIVNRKRRENNNPVIHYGTSASGNEVMKDAKTRDELGRKEKAICWSNSSQS